MPSIEGGEVEKKLFFYCCKFSFKIKDISVITISRKYQKNKFNKKIKFISLNLKIWDKFGRRFKYFFSYYFARQKNIKRS